MRQQRVLRMFGELADEEQRRCAAGVENTRPDQRRYPYNGNFQQRDFRGEQPRRTYHNRRRPSQAVDPG